MERVAAGFERIVSDPAKMNGQPCIRGTRLTVRRVLQIVGDYKDRAEITREFPELHDEDIREALAFAASRLEDRVVELQTAK
ncbi:MAG: DUF433 domain-containing protein [Candidatus Sumerlaeaceae bacterium]|nr:DUF433 domain-containing protein [Candidatus Sumerlaeaceae bacterium]